MDPYLKEALDMRDELVAHRRYLHAHAELGFELPQTVAYVCEKLLEYGYDPLCLGGGVTCTVGSGSPVILLRGGMDALPQDEVSGLDFACKNGTCHSCGHDGHTTMLLAAAKLLKAHETELQGTVKFCFQPVEELLHGSAAMIEASILENPKVDAAMALHQDFGPREGYTPDPGTIAFNDGAMMASADAFSVKITGRSAHGSMPQLGISALQVATDLANALTRLPTLEMPGDEMIILSVCRRIASGTATNIIPDSAVVKGSFRTYNRACRAPARARHGAVRAPCRRVECQGGSQLPTEHRRPAQRRRHGARDGRLLRRHRHRNPPCAAAEGFGGFFQFLRACPVLFRAAGRGRRRVRLARSARPDRRRRPALRRSGSEQLRRQVAGCPEPSLPTPTSRPLVT